MAAKPLTREEIANTEKKLDMPLDDIIKMSKNSTSKAMKQPRVSNKSQSVFNQAAQDNKTLKVRRYMDSRPFVRQGVLAQRRSNFKRNQFPIVTEIARKAVGAPFRRRPFFRDVVPKSNTARNGGFVVQRRAVNGGFAKRSPQHPHQPQQNQQQQQQQQMQPGDGGSKQRPKTLDSLFANMKEQRMKVLSRQNNNWTQNGFGRRPRVPWARGRFGN